MLRSRALRGLAAPLVTLLIACAVPAAGVTLRTGQTVITVPQDETVDGNTLTAVQSIEVSGPIKGNLCGASQSIRLESGGQLDGDLFAAAAIVAVTVGRGITIRGDTVNLASGAKVGGKVKAYVHNRDRVRVEPGATVTGGVDTQLLPAGGRSKPGPDFFGILLEFADALLAGFVLFALALLTLAVYLCGLYVAKIVVAGFLGQVLRKAIPTTRMDWFLALVIGPGALGWQLYRFSLTASR